MVPKWKVFVEATGKAVALRYPIMQGTWAYGPYLWEDEPQQQFRRTTQHVKKSFAKEPWNGRGPRSLVSGTILVIPGGHNLHIYLY